MPPLLDLRSVACHRDSQQQPVFQDVNLTINNGDIIVLQGKSGSGKTTLLKCIAHLVLYSGQVLFHGCPVKTFGIPSYRTKVLYVPQRPSMLPGTPRDFITAIASLGSHRTRLTKEHQSSQDPIDRAIAISRKWDIDMQLWKREWSNLSGGEAQRIALAIAVGLDSAEIILLDEPTSALDPVSSAAVEKYMLNEVQSSDSTLKALVWITHSDEQGGRVGNRFLQITAGGCYEDDSQAV